MHFSTTKKRTIILRIIKNILNTVFLLLTVSTIMIQAQIPITETFDYTGLPQTFVVPNDVTQLEIDVIGASGGGINPGKQGRVQTKLSVIPGDVLKIYVGGVGQNAYLLGEGEGWNGGGGS
jgi:hypothetical protein